MEHKEGQSEVRKYILMVERAPQITSLIVMLVITALIFDTAYEEYQPSFNRGVFDMVGMLWGIIIYLLSIFIPISVAVQIVKGGKAYFEENKEVIGKFEIARLEGLKKDIDTKIARLEGLKKDIDTKIAEWKAEIVKA